MTDRSRDGVGTWNQCCRTHYPLAMKSHVMITSTRTRKFTLVGCAIVALSGACNSSTEPARDLGLVPNVAFTTDASGYVARRIDVGSRRYQFTIVSRFENRGPTSVYLGRCFPDSPQPLFSVTAASPSTEESAYSQVWGCVGHNNQFEIQPGGSRTDTLRVEGPNIFPSGSTTGFGITEGAFQLYYDVRLGRGDGAPLAPMEMRLSNAFIVRTSD